VGTIRHCFRDHPALAALLLVAALCLKVLVPAGTMPTAHGNGIVVTLCSGAAMTIHIDTGKDAGKHQDGRPASAVDHPCTFAPLSAAGLGSAPPALVLAALAFAFVAAILLPTLALRPAEPRSRPPTHAPPAFA
jgi:hypothetical protein